jgi:glyoxylase-like metal-dependent hydrolase (beta-lactamase superfamily II)
MGAARGSTSVLGQVDCLAEGLWFIHGEMPEHAGKAPDFCNVVIYRAGNRLYMVDSSGGQAVRDSIRRVLREVGPVDSFTLINTHAHLDHICNNDLIAEVESDTKHHYLLRAAIDPRQLDAPGYFAEQFDRMEAVYDPLSSYQTERARYRLAGLIRDVLGGVLGHRRVMRWLFALQLRRFAPVGASRETMRAIDDLPRERIDIGGITWEGWRLGGDDVYVLDARSHSGCDVFVYTPAHRLLCMGDSTFPLFPTWFDSSRERTLDVLRKALAMTKAGSVAVLADGHGDRCYRGRPAISALLASLLDDHMMFERALAEVFSAADGLTPGEVYDRFRRLPDFPVVRKYLDLEYPHTPPSLQNVMVTTMQQLGYPSRGPWRRRRFYRPEESTPNRRPVAEHP